MTYQRSIFPLVYFLLFALISACSERDGADATSDGASSSSAPRAVRIALNWFPEAEHGGFFAAELNGHNRAAGLKAELLAGGPGMSVIPRVATGQVEFGVCNADELLLARAQGAPVVALFAPIQTSPRCIMVHEESGITSFAELRDVTLAMSASSGFAAFLKTRLPLDGVRIVPYGGTVSPFLLDKRHAQQGYVFSEPIVARQKGARPRALLVAELGYNPYTSLLITSEALLRDSPELAHRAALAASAGWTEYMRDPAPVNTHINTLNPEMSVEVLGEAVEALRPLMMIEGDDAVPMGTMTLERWRELARAMESAALLKPGAVDPAAAFTGEFISPASEESKAPQ